MIPSKIENSIVKYLTAQINAQELDALEVWLQDVDNKIVFEEYVKTNFLIDINTKDFDKVKMLKELSAKINAKNKTKHKYRIKMMMRYAAFFVLCFSAILIYQTIFNAKETTTENLISEVVLKSENGLVTILNQEGELLIKTREGKTIGKKTNNTLVYNNNETIKNPVYNTLTVPYGKQFSIQLSDGTRIQLNAGTSIRFPEKFVKGQERKVFIEYGQAFFDVAKDSKHPFIVNKNNIDIKVLGTQFDVSAYPEDQNITTVLVEGSVQLVEQSNKNKKTMLKPGYQAVWQQGKEKFDIKQADIYTQTGWRTGKIVLKSLAFKQMVIKLERHYDVKIDCFDDQLNEEIITATFDEENIEDVLKLINKINPIQYKVEGREIQITKNKKL